MMDNATRFCPNCGTKIPADAEFCSNCGADLRALAATMPASPKTGAASPETGTASPNRRAASSEPGVASPKEGPASSETSTAQTGRSKSDSTDAGTTQSTQAQHAARAATSANGQTRSGQPARVGQVTAGAAAPERPMKTGTKVLLGAAAVVIIAGVGFGLWGKSYYARDKQLDRAMAAMSKGDAATTASYLTSDDPALKLTKSSVKPLMAYLKAHKELLQQIKSANSQTASSSNFSFTQSGKQLLIFPAYKFKIKAAYPTVETNQKGQTVTVEGVKGVGFTGKAEDGKKVGPLVPGEYHFESTATVSGQKASASATADLFNNLNSEVDLSIQTVNVTVDGYPGAEVHVDGKPIGTIGDDGYLRLTNFPVTSSTKLTEIYTADGNTVESRAINLADNDGYEIQVAYPGVISHDNAADLISTIWEYDCDSLANYPDDADSELEELYGSFTDGASNKYAKSLVAMVSGYATTDGLDSTSIETDFKHIYPLAENKAQAIFNVTYTFYTDDQTHIQAFQYKGEIDKTDNGDFKLVTYDLVKKLEDKKED